MGSGPLAFSSIPPPSRLLCRPARGEEETKNLFVGWVEKGFFFSKTNNAGRRGGGPRNIKRAACRN